MVLQKTTFTRLFPVVPRAHGLTTTSTSFGFESAGTRFFDVTVPGHPKIEQGMTVIALLEKPNGFDGNGLLGWVSCEDGSLVCDSAFKNMGIFLLYAYFTFMFPMRAYAIIDTPANANIVAFCVAALFGSFACRFLYLSAKAFLVKRTLVAVLDSLKSIDAESLANMAVESDARQKAARAPHLER